jgi:multimeric flavodoxin WrbA
MRAFIICGSREGGFTSAMCSSFSKGLAEHGISSEVIFPLNMDIKHCTGCGECSKTGECIIDDEMSGVYKEFEKCDLLVLASPIHFSGPSSIIKTVIDRFQPVWFIDKKHPAYAAGLLSGGSMKPGFSNTVSIFKALSITAKMEWLGQLEISGTDEKETVETDIPTFNYGKEIGSVLIKDRK